MLSDILAILMLHETDAPDPDQRCVVILIFHYNSHKGFGEFRLGTVVFSLNVELEHADFLMIHRAFDKNGACVAVSA